MAPRSRLPWTCAAAALLAMACGSSGGGTDTTPSGDLPTEAAVDVAAPDADATPTDEAPAETPEIEASFDPGSETATDTVEVELPPEPDGPPLARHVNPMIGTGGALFNLGSSLPGATAPFGLVKVSPDTSLGIAGSPPGFQHCAGYRYEDDHLYGFTHNHLHGTGAGDYGNVLLLPTVGMSDAKTTRDGYKTPFTHDNELSRTGYYAVTLTEPKVRAELTATTHCAHHRYQWLDKPAEGIVLIDAAAALLNGRSKGGTVTIDGTKGTVDGDTWNDGEFSGRYGGFKIYFTSRYNVPMAGGGTWVDGTTQDNRMTVSTDKEPASFGAYVKFATASTPVVEFQVCLSYVSLDGARAAMAAEMPTWDFEGERAATEAAWEKELAKIEVKGGSPDDKINFYTAMYHVLQMPTIWTDVDGMYTGFDHKPHKAEGFTYVTDMSLWDTYRTENPLLALVWPEWQMATLKSLTAMVQQGGYVPKWSMGAGDTGSMIGEHAASTAADSYLKGLTDFDAETLWAGLKQTADGPLPSGSYGDRGCIQAYLDKGYCPADVDDGSVSKTLEYAFNDFCLSKMAAAMGKTEDADRYAKRAASWKNLWDGSTFFLPRKADGTFVPTEVDVWTPEGYVEGSVWQWSWFVPHDELGLQALFASKQAFVDKLTQFFQFSQDNFQFEMPNAYYFHGNEPDFHAPYMFIRAGRPDLTQKWARWVLQANYLNTPDGLSGNDDAGAMAAWYVFTAVGLFPWPCIPGYYITSPAFEQAVLHLKGGDVTIVATGTTQGKGYIKKATWNGKALDTLWIDHADLAKGGTLELTMSETP